MAIADKLTTIAGIKTDIRTAINGKGGSLTSGSPFSAYSAAISSLPSGGYPPDWSQIGYTSTPQFILDGFPYAKTIHDNWDPTVTNLRYKFGGDTSLVYMPMVETSGVTRMNEMFSGCTNLSAVPLLNTSACTSMGGMFHSCNLITSVPQFDTSSVTDMSYMFYGCSRLATVPLFDTSSATDMTFMFNGCSRLATVPAFNTSACTNMGRMFYECGSLTTVPQFDTSKVNNMSYMFYGCGKLTDIPSFDTREVTNMSWMFQSAFALQKIAGLDMDKCTNVNNMLSSGNLNNLRFMLLKGLGTPSGMTSYGVFYRITNWGVDSTEIPDARQSLVDTLLTYSFDRATAGYSTCTIRLSSNSYNQLTAQEIADIQAKGYNITT